ncbi:hypothetical protein SUGI_0208000 [Cryptomeria japonica]|nr:hypothetical protein SUGI_0208000 [Cryptomeria japonica]
MTVNLRVVSRCHLISIFIKFSVYVRIRLNPSQGFYKDSSVSIADREVATEGNGRSAIIFIVFSYWCCYKSRHNFSLKRRDFLPSFQFSSAN